MIQIMILGDVLKRLEELERHFEELKRRVLVLEARQPALHEHHYHYRPFTVVPDPFVPPANPRYSHDPERFDPVGPVIPVWSYP